MLLILLVLDTTWPGPALAAEEPATTIPGFNERLNQAVGSEGGVQVY